MATPLDVEVPGGRLHAMTWGDATSPAVLLIHGITASHVAWTGVAEALSNAFVLAPDLRGRGASSDLGGPYGMARHAQDMVALLDAAGVERAVVVGHSMGGFVSLVLARRHPERVSRLVLVDGGPPLPIPEDVPAELVLKAVVGPALDRLATTFPTREAYLDFWRAHPAFEGQWSPMVEAYADYDLVGEPPTLRSRVNPDAVTGDGVDSLTGPDLPDAMSNVTHPVVLLLAARGMLNEPAPLYPPEVVDPWLATTPGLTARRVEDVNHYTILFNPVGVAEVVAEIKAALTP